MTEKEQPKKKIGAFTKEQFLRTRQRSGIEKNILSVVLNDDKTYTIAEAERLIKEFKNRKVKQ